MVDFCTCPDEWLRRALGHIEDGRERPAEEALHRAVAGYRAAGQVAQEARCCYRLGLLYCRQARGDQAETAFLAALAGWRAATQVDADVVACQAELGSLYAQTGRLVEAERALAIALRLAEEPGEPGYSVDDLLLGHGRVLHELGRVEEAKKDFEAALSGFKERGNLSGVGGCRWELCEVALREGSLEDALLQVCAASAAFEAAGDEGRVADCAYQTGAIQMDRGRYPAAEDALERALAIRCRQPAREWAQARCRHSFALLYAITGRPDAADAEFRAAAALYEQAGAPLDSAWERADWARFLAGQVHLGRAAGLIVGAVVLLDSHRYQLADDARLEWTSRMGGIVHEAQQILADLGDPELVGRAIFRARVDHNLLWDSPAVDRQAARALDWVLLDAAHRGAASREAVSGHEG